MWSCIEGNFCKHYARNEIENKSRQHQLYRYTCLQFQVSNTLVYPHDSIYYIRNIWYSVTAAAVYLWSFLIGWRTLVCVWSKVNITVAAIKQPNEVSHTGPIPHCSLSTQLCQSKLELSAPQTCTNSVKGRWWPYNCIHSQLHETPA